MSSENPESLGPETAPDFHESGVPFETSVIETIVEKHQIETEQLIDSVEKVEGRIEVFAIEDKAIYEGYDFICVSREHYWPDAITALEDERASAVSQLHRRQAKKWGITSPAMVLWKSDVYELEICGLDHKQARFAVRKAAGQPTEEIERALNISSEESQSYMNEIVERARQARFFDEWFDEHFQDS